ncbi:hypothetical protein DOTSEDRAFT_22275 [Dothistroma septosporum NZE10]|uniref:Peptidase M12A domain-containing protein n=1 Tax=Dothistroma septosporum (strain NZE10 / CBS 128990) TaxID=675120 RepID=N1PV00_DOTSN|nr:hypothetical protein DOTSEDRAFT_22275 [Dothistroma septosporum NZE10]
MWEPATVQNSSSLLEFASMNAKDANSICNQGTQAASTPDVLNIFDTTKSRSPKTDCSLGYDRMIMEDKNNGVTASRWHSLYYQRLASQPNANDEVVTVGPLDRVRMAHELGHALGLDREFQRHERNQLITFNCQNLGDYKDGKKIIDSKDTSECYRAGDMIEQACINKDIADRYGFSASQYVIEGQGFIGQLQHSVKFDYDSIMMYDSYAGSAPVMASGFPKGAVMVGKGQKG